MTIIRNPRTDFLLIFIGIILLACSRHEEAVPVSAEESCLQAIIRDAFHDRNSSIMLTEAPVILGGQRLVISVTYDISALIGCWTPEVAVQYCFDLIMVPIAHAIFEDLEDRFGDVNLICIRVSPTPDRRWRAIDFELKKDDWVLYHINRSIMAKTLLYQKMQIIADGEPLRFNAALAVDIE